ncbi:hypothetical protein TNIN_4161 [Trichonephila inaurata madagascariensis]|uniref:Uncharacterized protein n=1 Tax=Trichonephila inaurata madagascariensis TaxID=2747483 RepID=A0A8X7CN50_9ARAC|nr:hypothetical protein TNIN_4161 [Trichonephila inaurata madagascariensis]
MWKEPGIRYYTSKGDQYAKELWFAWGIDGLKQGVMIILAQTSLDWSSNTTRLRLASSLDPKSIESVCDYFGRSIVAHQCHHKTLLKLSV